MILSTADPNTGQNLRRHPNVIVYFASYNRFFKIVIDKKEEIMIANSDVYIKVNFILRRKKKGKKDYSKSLM